MRCFRGRWFLSGQRWSSPGRWGHTTGMLFWSQGPLGFVWTIWTISTITKHVHHLLKITKEDICALKSNRVLPCLSCHTSCLICKYSRYLRFSFFSLCFSVSLPRSFPSFCFSSDFSLFLCLFLCFFPTTGISKGTGGGGLGVRGPFFLLWPPFDDLVGNREKDFTF